MLDPHMAFNSQRDGIRLLQATLVYPDKLDLLYKFMNPKVGAKFKSHIYYLILIARYIPHGLAYVYTCMHAIQSQPEYGN